MKSGAALALEALAQADTENVADLRELGRSLMDEFGGPMQLAKICRETFEDAPTGGMVRVQLLKQMLEIVKQVTQISINSGSLRDPADVSDEQLLEDVKVIFEQNEQQLTTTTSDSEAEPRRLVYPEESPQDRAPGENGEHREDSPGEAGT